MTHRSVRSRSLMMVAAFLALTLSAAAQAQRNTLKLGDAAPGFDIETWFNTDTGIQISPDQTYIIEFFTPDCTTCSQSLRRLGQLRDQMPVTRNVVILAIATDTNADDLKDYLRRSRGAISFPVGLDRRTSTKRAWMDKAGRETYPTAFIVDQRGIIQWIGNTNLETDQMENIFDLVTTGRYDAKVHKEVEDVASAAETARRIGNFRMAHKHYDDIIAHNPYINAPYALEKFEMMLVDQDDREGAYAYLNGLIDGDFSSDEYMLMSTAAHVALAPAIPDSKRDLDVALRAALAAADGANGTPGPLQVLARVRFARGEYGEAVRLQRSAWMMMPPQLKNEAKRVLIEYQAASRAKGGSRSERGE